MLRKIEQQLNNVAALGELPCEFDLIHDVKTGKRLIKELYYAETTVASLRKMMTRHNIILPDHSDIDPDYVGSLFK